MSEPSPQEFSVHNRVDLEDLAWEIESSEGQFSLLIARCNYTGLRDQLVEDLQQICAVPIRVLVLQASETALYTRIQDELKGGPPDALMVFGLETVADLERLLSTANQVREEFRKNCPFPIVLWVTDDVLKGLIHAAPDLESWATKTHFTLPPEALLQSLQQAVDSLFARLLTPGSSQSFEQLYKKLELEFLGRDEVRLAVQDLQRQEQGLEPELQAALNFARGLNAINNREVLDCFQQSLNVWQGTQDKAPPLNAPTTQLKIGLLLFYIGQTTYQICEQEKQPNWEAARVPLQQSVELFEQENRPDLVSKCITHWEQVLWQLQRWDELETVANKALKLHQTAIDSHRPYASLSRLAQDYGFLANIELQRQQWRKAAQAAQMALNVLEQRSDADEWVESRYFLLLAQAERQLGQLRAAEEHLLQAMSVGDRGQPQIYLCILQELRELYLQGKDYAKAFAAKQERFSIEQQYGIRAFIGAGRLQPSKQAVSTDDLSSQGMVAPEIAAAGRQQDLDRLIERVERRDYRLIVIHGNSGVGKSSLVNAGLVPSLKQKTIEARGNVPVVMRVYTQWMQELGRLLAEATGNPLLNTQSFTAQTLLEELRQIDQRNLRTVLIFDQFEEFFFVYPKPENRQPFFDFLVQCLQVLSLKVFLSLREDYLHYLLECSRLEGMKRTGIDILSQNVLYGLGNFDPQDAKAIIQSLTDRARFFLEPALVDQLVEDLARDVGTVRPIELQVVGAQLQAESITTLSQYRGYGQEPKQELVKRYLNGVVADCGAENEQVAELVLFLLTDEKGTRPLKTRAELEKELQALAASSGELSHSLDLVLQIFVDSGLVFLLPEFPADRYQLVHDYLATFIRQQQEDRLSELRVELAREREQRRLSDEQRKLSDKKLNRFLWVLTGSIAVGFGLAGLAAFAFGAAQQAEAQRKRAEISEINVLNIYSEILSISGRSFDALMESLRAAERLIGVDGVKATDTQVRTAAILQQAVSEVKEYNSLEKHGASVLSVSFSPDGKTLVSGSVDNTIKLWNLEGKELKTLKGHNASVLSVSFSPDGKTLVSGSVDNTIKLWNLEGKELKTLKGHNDFVYSVSFSPDGKTLVSGSVDNTIKLWNLEGKELKTLKGHNASVRSVSFSPDGKTLVSGSVDNTIKLWNLEGKELKTLKGHDASVRSVSFSPDGKTLVSSSADSTIKLWNLEGKELKTLKGHDASVRSVSFSPDGKTLVSSSADSTIKLWNLEGKELKTLKGHDDSVRSVSFSPDGKTLVSGSVDNTIKLWNLEGKELKTLKGHNDFVYSVSFSPDGKTLVSGSVDNTIKLWNLEGKELKTLKGHDDSVRSVSFSPDGKTLVSGSFDKTIKLWNLDLTDLLAQGCNWLHDYVATHPNALEALKQCQTKPLLLAAAPAVVDEGEDLARKGDVKAAIVKFRQALTWNPNLRLEPETRAQALANQGEAKRLVDEGKDLGQKGNFEESLVRFQAASRLDPSLKLDPESEVKKLTPLGLLSQMEGFSTERKFQEAIAAYTKAITLDPTVEISSNSLNSLCWNGSLSGFAKEVLPICEKAVALAPKNAGIRDSRGLARALTSDTKGAIEDFQVFIAQASNNQQKSQRQRWVKALSAGKNPFTPEELKSLVNQ